MLAFIEGPCTLLSLPGQDLTFIFADKKHFFSASRTQQVDLGLDIESSSAGSGPAAAGNSPASQAAGGR